MSHHTIRTSDLPLPWMQKTGAVIQWLAPSKNFCISLTCLVALWVIVYCTVKALGIPDGTTALIGVLLGVNAAHSYGQAREATKAKNGNGNGNGNGAHPPEAPE